MAEFGKVSWKSPSKSKSLTMGEAVELAEAPRKSFFQYYHSQFPSKETVKFSKTFQNEYERLERAIFDSKAAFKNIPLVSAFVEWVEKAYSQTYEEVEDAILLLKHGFIGIKDSEGSTWTLHHASLHDPNEIYNAIRCRRDMSLIQRERLVLAYRRFLSYLSFRTHGYINPRDDSERWFIKDRALKLIEFAQFADQLKDNLQLVAKLLYFGGDRILDEILNMKISDVDFEEHLIQFGAKAVSYPLHVFADIQAIVGKRSKGKVFLGRQEASLSPTTVFRNFKSAGVNAGKPWLSLPSQLTEKLDLIENE